MPRHHRGQAIAVEARYPARWGLSRDWGDYAAFANVGSGWDTDSNRWPNPESSVPL
jgi:hypothetical protein